MGPRWHCLTIRRLSGQAVCAGWAADLTERWAIWAVATVMVGAAEAAALFAAAAKRPGKRRLRKLYAAVSDDSGLQYVCGLIGYLRFLGPDLGCI